MRQSLPPSIPEINFRDHKSYLHRPRTRTSRKPRIRNQLLQKTSAPQFKRFFAHARSQRERRHRVPLIPRTRAHSQEQPVATPTRHHHIDKYCSALRNLHLGHTSASFLFPCSVLHPQQQFLKAYLSMRDRDSSIHTSSSATTVPQGTPLQPQLRFIKAHLFFRDCDTSSSGIAIPRSTPQLDHTRTTNEFPTPPTSVSLLSKMSAAAKGHGPYVAMPLSMPPCPISAPDALSAPAASPSDSDVSSGCNSTDSYLRDNCATCGYSISDFVELESYNERLQNDRYTLGQEVKDLKNKLKTALETENKAQKRCEALVQKSIYDGRATLETKNGNLRKEMGTLQKKMQGMVSLQKKVEDLTGSNKKLKEDSEPLQQKLKEALARPSNDELEEQVKICKQAAEQAEREKQVQVAKYKRAAEDAIEEKELMEASMPGKNKQKNTIKQQKSHIEKLQRTNAEKVAAVDSLEVKLRRMTQNWDDAKDEKFKLCEALTSTESNLGSLESSPKKLQRQLTAALEKNATMDDVTQQLAAAQEIVSLAKHPLECYAKIRRRLFRSGRADRYLVNEEGNRMAHDGNLVADASMMLLDNLSELDADCIKPYYPAGSFDTIKSYEDVARLQSRGFAQELIDLRASMKLEDSSTRVSKLTDDFRSLDERCMKRWEALGGGRVSDEAQCRRFNDNEEVDEMVQEMRIIRKKAAGWVGSSIAYGDEPVATTDLDGVCGAMAGLGLGE